MELPIPRPDDLDARWGGFSRSLDHPFPLDKIRREGYDVEPVEDERGKYYRIIKQVIK